MPSLSKDFLTLLKNDYTKYPCFVESGTHMGETIFAMEQYFNRLYTIEFSERYYNTSKSLYNGDKIRFILGDSGIVLKDLSQELSENCIFFLDGHWSSGDTGKSEKDCPLVEEITHINDYFLYEAIIIIDDYRLFGLDKSSGKLDEDWSKINKDELLSILKSRITKVYHLDSQYAKDDRLIIHIRGF